MLRQHTARLVHTALRVALSVAFHCVCIFSFSIPRSVLYSSAELSIVSVTSSYTYFRPLFLSLLSHLATFFLGWSELDISNVGAYNKYIRRLENRFGWMIPRRADGYSGSGHWRKMYRRIVYYRLGIQRSGYRTFSYGTEIYLTQKCISKQSTNMVYKPAFDLSDAGVYIECCRP